MKPSHTLQSTYSLSSQRLPQWGLLGSDLWFWFGFRVSVSGYKLYLRHRCWLLEQDVGHWNYGSGCRV